MAKIARQAKWMAALAAVVMVGSAQAALMLQGNGSEVLDTKTGLLWLKDWNANATNGGLNNWSDSKDWAAGLTVGGAAAGDWRLPEIDEYVGLYSDLDVGGTLAGLQKVFDNVQSYVYWSGTEVAPGGDAWSFSTFDGFQYDNFQVNELYAVAVRPGDVAAGIPEPQTLGLVGLALGAAVFALRKRPV